MLLYPVATTRSGCAMSPTKYDVVVIGAGIAGASIAAHLAENGRVGLLEMAGEPGFNSTGRSAAMFIDF